MNSPNDGTPLATDRLESDAGERRRRMWVFGQWCLQREAFNRWAYLSLLAPLFVAGISTGIVLSSDWYPGQGRGLFKTLSGISAFFIFVGGVRHASKAVCWEVSAELRDLVRLTGIAPATLLLCQTLCRWWTIGLSILLMLPLAMFAKTLGGATSDQWIALGGWLVLLTVLTAGFAMIAGVSSGRASNADTTAATATFLMMIFYHVFFWGIGIALWAAWWLVLRRFDPPFGSLARDTADFAFSLPPIVGLCRSLASPSLFSLFAPPYWLHFLTGVFCLRMASVVMRNRFRVSSQGDPDASEIVTTTGALTSAPLRPRCTDRPFFWKDTYILGGGEFSESFWFSISFIATIGVGLGLTSEILFGNGISLVIGILSICAAPWIVAFRFDASMAAEFREQTWTSLILLPIDPRRLLFAKIEAAVWERRAIFLPVGLAALIACFTDATAVFMATTIAILLGALLFQVSILSQFNAKLWWAGPAVGSLVILLLAFILVAWINFARGASFAITMMIMITAISGFQAHISWRLHNWTEP